MYVCFSGTHFSWFQNINFLGKFLFSAYGLFSLNGVNSFCFLYTVPYGTIYLRVLQKISVTSIVLKQSYLERDPLLT